MSAGSAFNPLTNGPLGPGRTRPTADLLRFGLPSKGRLQAQVADYLARAGLTLEKSSVDREYAGELHGLDKVELVFLQAGEVPGKLASGEIHVGVTGEDLIREKTPGWRRQIHLAQPLGFGRADLVVAAPKCWIDVATTDDLDDVAADFRERHGHPLRIATKYARLARAFFRAKGVANYRLVDSQGATEGVVAAGAAEAIVDITSTGETLRANHLKVLEDGLILKSEAQLCLSLSAVWGGGALEALRGLLDRVGGASSAPSMVRISARIERGDLDRAEAALVRLGALFEQRPLTGFPGQATLTSPEDKLGFVIDILTASGASAVETEPAAGAPEAPQAGSLFERFMEQLAAQEG